jgi:excisionase family DNA binding protein
MAPPPSRIPPLLTIPAVAERLGVSTRTVRRWISRKELHVHQLGRQLRVSEEDLKLFVGRTRK